MMMLLRLAVILKHVEVVEEIPDLSVAAKDDTLTLTYPREWGEDHPLTIRDVEQSVPAVKRLGITLTLKPV